MLAIPVVELKNGYCVRVHSQNNQNKIIQDDPVQVFEALAEQGARTVHVVDTDAIRNGLPEHITIVEKIKKSFPDIELQVMGGVNTTDDVLIWLDAGAACVVVSGKVVRHMSRLEMFLMEFGREIIINFDVKASLWQQGYCPVNGMCLAEWTRLLEEEGIAALMFKQIPEKGQVNGHSLLAAGELASRINVPVIAHGGVNSRTDLANLSNPEFDNLYGVTLGKSLFDGKFSFSEVISMLPN